MIALVCVLMTVMVVMLTPRSTNAGGMEPSASASLSASQNRDICYTSYEIQRGDTLWTIGDRFGVSDSAGLNEFVGEVCRLNHLSDANQIYAGRKICIPHRV